MTLCEVDDVLRVLKSTSSTDSDNIEPVLEAVSDWISTVYGAIWDIVPGTVVTQKYFNINPDGFIKLPDPNPANIVLHVIPGIIGFPDDYLTLQEVEYEYVGDGVVQLTVSNLVAVPGIDYVAQRVMMRPFREVDITWTSSGVVPAPVREACALITAASYAQQDVAVRGLKMERIGNYQYQTDAAKAGLYVPMQARAWLRPYGRKRHARII